MIAWAIAIAIMLNALGVFAIRLAIAYAITKKANHKDQLKLSHLKLRLELATGTRQLLFFYYFNMIQNLLQCLEALILRQ